MILQYYLCLFEEQCRLPSYHSLEEISAASENGNVKTDSSHLQSAWL